MMKDNLDEFNVKKQLDKLGVKWDKNDPIDKLRKSLEMALGK